MNLTECPNCGHAIPQLVSDVVGGVAVLPTERLLRRDRELKLHEIAA